MVLLTQMLAAFAPQAVLWLLAAFLCTAFPLLRHWKKPGWLPVCVAACAMLCALTARSIYWNTVVAPVRAYAGERTVWTARVQETTPGYYDGAVNATLAVVARGGAALPHSFLVQARSIPACEPGEITEFSAVLQNVSENKYAASSYAKGIFLTAQEIQSWDVIGVSPTLFTRCIQLRQQLGGRLREALPGENGAIAAAMTLGDKTGLNASIKEAFRSAGFSHALVVSGLHLSIVCGLIYGMLRRWIGFRAAAAAALAGNVVFVLLAGCTPSLLRAGCAAALLYLGMLLGRSSDALTSLGFSALLLCLANPFAAVDVGLLLSYSATLGVLAAAALSQRLEQRLTAGRRGEEGGSVCWAPIGVSWVRKLLRAFFISAGASLFTMPVLAAMGGSVSILGVFCNLAAVPLLAVIVESGLLFTLCAALPPLAFVARLSGLACGLCVKSLYGIARWTQTLSWNTVHLTGPAAVCCAAFAGLLLYVAWRLHFSLRFCFATSALFVVLCLCSYGLCNINVVQIAVVGESGNPAVVVTQGLQTAVLYRGPDSNLKAIREYLEQNNRSGVDILIDLRSAASEQTPVADALGAKSILCVQEEIHYRTVLPLFEKSSLRLLILRQPAGNYACLNLSGFTFGLASGKINMEGYAAPEIYLAGTAEPEHWRCGILLVPATGAAWVEQAPEAQTVCYSEGTPQILLRLGRSVQMKEVRYDPA